MYDEVAVVDKHPLTVIGTFEPNMVATELAKLLSNPVGHGNHLPLRSTRSDHEDIRNSQQIANIEQYNVGGSLVIYGIRRNSREVVWIEIDVFRNGQPPAGRSSPTMIVRSTTPLGWCISTDTSPSPNSSRASTAAFWNTVPWAMSSEVS